MNAITELCERKNLLKLPVSDDYTLEDFKLSPVVPADGMSESGKKYLEAYKPFIDSVNWSGKIFGGTAAVKRHEATYKLMAAIALSHIERTPTALLQREATLAGTDIPTFTKMLIRVVLQAYPKLIAPQLFPTIPLTMGPDGRIYFERSLYDSAFASSAPNIAQGDQIADLTKFNTAFALQSQQLKQLGKIKLDMSNYIVVSANTYGLVAEWSIPGEEDYAAIYGGNLVMALSERLQSLLSWIIDRTMINAAVAAVPTGDVSVGGNNITWKRTPTLNGVTWANQNPSEKLDYRATIWTDGIEPLRTAIYKKYYVMPNWLIVSPSVAEDIRKVRSFQPIDGTANDITIRLGAIRDLGSIDSGSMRVIVDPMMVNNTALLGYMPAASFEPAIYFLPYKPIGFTDTLTIPGTLGRSRGGYTRFAVGQPDTGQNAASSILGVVYGLLTVSDTP